MIEYFINSNTGDYLTHSLSNNKYTLNLIRRSNPSVYQPHITIDISPSDIHRYKGFVRIKRKKLFRRVHRNNTHMYAPTLKGGVKGISERMYIPTIEDHRNKLIESLGII